MVCVDQLLEDNFRRMETRDRLGSTQLLAASQGGYHTPMTMGYYESDISTARQKLSSMKNRGPYDYGSMARRAKGNPRR